MVILLYGHVVLAVGKLHDDLDGKTEFHNITPIYGVPFENSMGETVFFVSAPTVQFDYQNKKYSPEKIFSFLDEIFNNRNKYADYFVGTKNKLDESR